MKKFILLLCAFLCMSTASAKAHVLIADTTNEIGAVLHISPDDDPIAGEPSELFFEIQSKAVSVNSHSFVLTVTDSVGVKVYVPINPTGNTVSATYTFHSQGVYTIVLLAEPLSSSAKTLAFQQDQRVSRGEISDNHTQPSFMWAEMGIAGSVCSILVIGIVVWNRRSALASYVRIHKF